MTVGWRAVRVIGVALGVVAVVALLWIGGEQHRANCIAKGRVNCSVLPWANGELSPEQSLKKKYNLP